MINFLSIARQSRLDKMSKTKAAEILGVTRQTVTNMENNETILMVSIGTIFAYCQLLEIKTIEVPEKIKS